MTVPKGKEVWIGNKRYREGDPIPEHLEKHVPSLKPKTPAAQPAPASSTQSQSGSK